MTASNDDESWQCCVCLDEALDPMYLTLNFGYSRSRGYVVDFDDEIWLRCNNCYFTFHAKCSVSFKDKTLDDLRKCEFRCCHSKRTNRLMENEKKRELSG